MDEMDSFAVVRYVWRNSSQPKLGVLMPHRKEGYQCLLYAQLPFREDVRPFTFPSLSAMAGATPTPEQLSAMGDFVERMDLMKAFTVHRLAHRSPRSLLYLSPLMPSPSPLTVYSS